MNDYTDAADAQSVEDEHDRIGGIRVVALAFVLFLCSGSMFVCAMVYAFTHAHAG